MEDYEKLYKDAIERAKQIQSTPYTAHWDVMKEVVEHIFPVLKNDDERIRRAIMKLIDMKNIDSIGLPTIYGASYEEMLSWVEAHKEPEDKGEISDGYHTFNELYRYRMLYNAAFFNLIPAVAHKSKKHHDGEECFGGGWFIVIANLPTGQISNHYELEYWDLFKIPQKEVADEWDGHTPQEAADRLYEYLKCCRIHRQNENDFDRGYEVGASAEKYNQWKPSDEQMIALLHAIGDAKQRCCDKDGDRLQSLYNDLEKLI